MSFPRTGDRLGGSDYPFDETLPSLHDAVRANVEAVLGNEYRVTEIRATHQSSYARPRESEGEISPAHIPPFVMERADLEFAVRAVNVTKIQEAEVIELIIGLAGGELIVKHTSIVAPY